MTEVNLLSAAWYGDEPITVDFPSSWDVTVVGERIAPALTNEMIRERLNSPVGSPSLSDLASKKDRVAVVIDDITRPTPSATLIPFILEELGHAGVAESSITIVVAGGTHRPASRDEIIRKVGSMITSIIKIVPHDCTRGLRYLGRSSRGTPLYVNQAVIECDLKIGVGGIYPHPAAGFSGGSKIIVPGVCGIETAQTIHDYLQGARQTGGALDTDLRLEMDEVAAQVGLDFIVNVVLNQERRIAGLFAGDKTLAHRQGVEFASELYTTSSAKDADVIVADTYPFDTSLQFARDRGFWPLIGVKDAISMVAIAACPMGMGSHDLYPISHPVRTRLSRRLRNFRPRDLSHPVSTIRTVSRLLKEKRQQFMVLSCGITETELRSVYPKARLHKTWNGLLRELEYRHKNLPVKVVVHKCAPLQVPTL